MMDTNTAEALKREFGYVPDKDAGEQWTVYRDRALLVFHPERLIKVFRRGALGEQDYCECNPAPWL
jgi:hypothetical protein